MDVTQEILSEITTYMKYAKYKPELNRRETWEELVTRNKEMHQNKFPKLKDEIEVKMKKKIFNHIKLKNFYQICKDKFNNFIKIRKFEINFNIKL